MAREPKPERGMPRSLLYVMIPAGFALLVLIMVLSGWWTAETSDEVETVPGVAGEEAVQD